MGIECARKRGAAEVSWCESGSEAAQPGRLQVLQRGEETWKLGVAWGQDTTGRAR